MADPSHPRYQAFLSHNTADKPAVEELARRLEQDGISCFLDKWHLIPGEPWQVALEEALDQSECCVVFFGPSGLGPWQNEEMRAAIARRVATSSHRVVPVLLPGGQREQRSRLPTFLVSAMWVEFQNSTNEEDGYHRLKCGIRGVPPGPSPGAALFEGECPYRGLQVFDADHARFFFGRDAEVDWILDRLANDFGTHQEGRFLGVVGASGSGKSSLVRAGLIPAIHEGRSRSGKSLPGSAEWPIVTLKPGTEPLKSMADALWSNEVSRPLVSDPLAFSEQLLTKEVRLHATIETLLTNTPESQRFVVVVDQFEELFTQCEDEAQRQAFIDNLMYAAAVHGGRTLVVITMRADFYGKCSRYEKLAHALSDRQELVPPLGQAELRAAIEQPAQLCGLELEPGLTDLLLQDMREQPAGALPLLQQTLLMLWDRRDGRRLTIQAYHDIGEIEGALEAHANQIYEQGLQSDEQREVCRRVLLMLTTPGEGTEDTRRRVPRSQLGSSEAVDAVLQQLVKGRLVTLSDTDPPRVEVTHEALIRGWHQLREWLDEDRDSLRILQQLVDAAEEWQANDRDPAYLYAGSRLSQAEEWRSQHADELADMSLANEFIDAAIERRDADSRRREAEEQQRMEMLQNLAETERQRAEAQESSKKRLRGMLAAVAGLLIAACVMGGFAYHTASELGISASDLDQRNGELSDAYNELDRQKGELQGAYDELESVNTELETERNNAIASSRQAYLALSDNEYFQGRIARDSNDSIEAAHHFYRAAAAARSGESETRSESYLIATAPESAQVKRTFLHDGPVRGALFSGDGTRVLTCSEDSTVRLWDVNQDEPIRTFKHDGPVFGAVFSAEERRVLTWGKDGTARLWDVNRDEPVRIFKHDGPVFGARFNVDESRILSWSGDGTARLWDVSQDDQELHTFRHEKWVQGAMFSADENHLLTWSGDDTVRLWDESHDDAPLRTFRHEITGRGVFGAEFSGDESRFLTWGYDATARLWDVNRDTPLRTFQHMSGVNGAAFSGDESRILTWSSDGAARLWDVSQDEPLCTFRHEEWVQGAAFSADESRVLTWSGDGTARLWDVSQDELLSTFRHDKWVYGAEFCANDSRILTWSEDGTARLWDVRNEEPIRTFHHEGQVYGAKFSADESRILSWSEDSTARLWDVTPDSPIGTYRHEDMVNGAEFAADASHVLTWSDDGTARLWDVTRDDPIHTYRHEDQVNGGEFAADASRVLTWSDDGTARLWDVTRDDPLRTFRHERAVRGAAFSGDGSRVLTWSDDGAAKLWDTSRNEPLRVFQHNLPVFGAVFSADESRLLTWDIVATARLWDVNSGESIHTFRHRRSFNGAGMRGAEFSADENRVLTWSDDGSARLWDVSLNKAIRTFKQEDGVNGAVLSADESRLVTWGDGSVRLWDINRDEPLHTFNHKGHVNGASLSADGSRVLAWSYDPTGFFAQPGTARLWDISQDEPLRTFHHKNKINGAEFSADESRVLTWSDDDTARLWDVSHDEPLRIFQHESDVSGAEFSADEHRVLTWSDDGTSRLWDVSFDAETPIAEQIRRHEIRTGTTIDNSGRLRVLSYDEWISRIEEVKLDEGTALEPDTEQSP